MNCLKCNSPLQSEDRFCPECGAPVTTPASYDNNPAPTPNPYYNHTYAPAQKSNTGLIAAIIIISSLILCTIIVTVTLLLVNKGPKDYNNTSEPTYSAPIFSDAVGSSTRSYDVDESTGQVIYYYDDYAIDNDMNTAWTPDRNADPVPSITLYANGKQRVHGIRMTNGYCKSERTYTKNKRISKVRITFAGGEIIEEFSPDHFREMLDVPFNEVAETDYITIQVLDTYYGEWNDIAISEIDVY